MKQTLLLILLYLLNFTAHAQNNSACENALPFCLDGSGYSSPNNINVEIAGQIACLGSTPNPSWHFIQIGNSGNVEIQISQINNSGNGIDVDFALWGPFNSIDLACSTLDFSYCQSCPNNTNDPNFYPFGNIVDCSFSPSNIENFTIESANDGEIYILLVTNYSNQSGTTTITQTNANQTGSGDIVGDFEIDLGPDQNLCTDVPFITLDASSPYGDIYEWYRNGFGIPGATEGTLVVTESGNYSVFALSQSCSAVAIDDIVVTFVDCDSTGLIHVNAFFDTNTNAVFDANETIFNNGYFTYELNNGITNFVSSSTGSFTLASSEETDEYNFAYYFYDEYQECYDVLVASIDNISVANDSEIIVDFPVVNEQSCEDIGINLIGSAAPRPGFSHTNFLSIENLGLVTTSGSIDFSLDSNLVLNSVSPNSNYTVTTTASGFTLDFVNLQPGFSINANVFLLCPETVAVGEMVTNTAILTTTSNDIVAENNTSSITETVIGSYDPNDMTESHGSQIVYYDFVASDGYLYYTIRFQNIGTAEAINVRIEDVLDSQLDENTFQMLRSSHDYTATRTGNQLLWQFTNINLPSESMDADASNGYVYFKIKPQAGYGIGDIIPNTADIYFDFNPPITTNTFNTEFVETLSVDGYNLASFSIYPNPANEVVSIQMNESLIGPLKVEVFDIHGKHVLSQNSINERTMQLDVSSLENGLYFIKMKNQTNEVIKKLIID